MTRWAYKVATNESNINSDQESAFLSALGEQGWELVSVVQYADQLVYYFKRGESLPLR